MSDEVVQASEYRGLAAEFEINARILVENTEWKPDGIPAKISAFPIYFLISHSAELLLKSALLKRGVSLKDLKSFKLRHNLVALLTKLRSFDLNVSEETIELIEGLDSMHQDHALRYRLLISGYTPPPEKLFDMLAELLHLTAISSQGR